MARMQLSARANPSKGRSFVSTHLFVCPTMTSPPGTAINPTAAANILPSGENEIARRSPTPSVSFAASSCLSIPDPYQCASSRGRKNFAVGRKSQRVNRAVFGVQRNLFSLVCGCARLLITLVVYFHSSTTRKCKDHDEAKRSHGDRNALTIHENYSFANLE